MQHLLDWLEQTFDKNNDPPEVARDIQLLRWMVSKHDGFTVFPSLVANHYAASAYDRDGYGHIGTTSGDPLDALRDAVERLKGLRR